MFAHLKQSREILLTYADDDLSDADIMSKRVALSMLDALAEVDRINELGDQFDIREFHHVLLTNGSVPLGILEDLVKQYIAEAKSAGQGA